MYNSNQKVEACVESPENRLKYLSKRKEQLENAVEAFYVLDDISLEDWYMDKFKYYGQLTYHLENTKREIKNIKKQTKKGK